MNRPFSPHPRRTQHARAFTLAEVLIALAIFTIGFIAIAAVFPAGVLLQRETMHDMAARSFGETSEALLLTRGFDGTDLDFDLADPQSVGAFPVPVLQRWANLPDDWSLHDRSYPTNAPMEERELFWVPLFLDTDPSTTNRSWRVFLFVARNQGGSVIHTKPGPATDWAVPFDNDPTMGDPDYVPGVRRVAVPFPSADRFDFGNNPRQVRVGDKIVDNTGSVYTVILADNAGVQVNGNILNATEVDHIWFVHPGYTDVNKDGSITAGEDEYERSAFAGLYQFAAGDTNNLIRE